MNKTFRPSSVRELVGTLRAQLHASTLAAGEREETQRFIGRLESLSPHDMAVYDLFLQHMPDQDADLELVILKGQLLVEYRLKEFLNERLLSPGALADARLTAHQVICLAEAMCLDNEDPHWLFGMARKLNALRNALAHNLAPSGIQEKVDAFVAEYTAKCPVQSGLAGCVGHLYAQVAELARMAGTPEYRSGGTGAVPPNQRL
jgi:hypothetical protein